MCMVNKYLTKICSNNEVAVSNLVTETKVVLSSKKH